MEQYDSTADTLKHIDGDILKSIEMNKERFGYGDVVANIFKNTVNRYMK
jgi:hypothetical protein